MKVSNPFDRRLEAQKNSMPTSVRDAAIHVTDTLDVAWAAAQAVFEKKAKPEHALTLLPLFLARADAERQRQVDELRGQTAGGSSQPPTRRRAGKAT